MYRINFMIRFEDTILKNEILYFKSILYLKKKKMKKCIKDPYVAYNT